MSEENFPDEQQDAFPSEDESRIPELNLYGIIRDAQGRPFFQNDEDLKTVPHKVWHDDFSQDEREYLTEKHGLENVPNWES